MIEPFYFKSDSKLLCGIYHSPGNNNRNTGIVICNPTGNEYIRTHRTISNLARELAENGYHVLKFDYYGQGDSYGDSKEENINQYLSDISAAITELFEGCDIKKIFVTGLRLGATLAFLSLPENKKIYGLIMWNPLINGSAYWKEIQKRHKELITNAFTKRKNKETEISGFPFSQTMIEQLKRIDISHMPPQKIEKILLITNENINNGTNDYSFLKQYANNYTCHNIPSGNFWIDNNDANTKSLIPVNSINYIVNWLNNNI